MPLYKKLILCIFLGSPFLFLLSQGGRREIYWAIYGDVSAKSHAMEIKDCRVLLKIFPNDSNTHRRLAYLLYSAYSFDSTINRVAYNREAAQEYEIAIALGDRSPTSYLMLGSVYEELDDLPKAETTYKTCLEQESQNEHCSTALNNVRCTQRSVKSR